MSIGICRVQKFSAPKDIAGIQIHHRRERNHSNSNPDIDRSRSDQNYTVTITVNKDGTILSANSPVDAPRKPYNTLIDERIRNGYKGSKAVRKDAVRCCEVLFTASGDFFDRYPEQTTAFFSACVTFAAKRFGAENIFAATVHMDEDTPHMHLDFVPLTADGRLSAKSVLGGRKNMQQLQDDFYEQVGKQFGLERGSRADLENAESEQPRKHLTTRQLKAQTVERLAELEQAQQRAIAETVSAENTALLAEDRAQQADQRTASAEERLHEAETRLNEVNSQYDAAARGLQTVLEKKARASEIHKLSHLFGETVEYHKNMLESTRAIGSEAYAALKQANQVKQEAVSIQQRAEKKEAEIEPLYRQAQAARQQAQEELKRQQQLRQALEQEIERRASELADKRIKAMFGGVPTSRSERLEQFCTELRFKDGTTALDAFEEQERKLRLRGQTFHL
jgi:hypothetical protein